MKLRALSLLVAGFAVVAMAQDGIKLRRVFTAGSEDTYLSQFSSTNSMETPQGPMDIKLKGSSSFIVKVNSVKDSLAEIDLITKDMKMDSDGGPDIGAAGDNIPKEIKVQAKLDDRNRLSEVKSGPGLNPMVQMMLSSLATTSSGYFIEFPEGSIKVGDTWEVAIPKMSEKSAVSGKMTAKLVSDKGETYEVEVSGDVPMKMDMADLVTDPNAGGAPEMVMTGTMKTSYKAIIQKSTGKALSIEGKVSSDLKLDIPSMNITMPGKGTVDFTAKLK